MGELEQMINSLGPNTGQLQWNLALYWIFFVNFIILFMMPDGATFQTLLSIAVLISAVIDKTFGWGYMLDPKPYSPEYYHEQIFIGTYLIRVAMFVAPLTVAGSTKSPKVRGMAIIAGISGAVYTFARWYFDQRENKTSMISMIDFEIAIQSVGMFLVLGHIMLRERFRLGRVDRHVPVAIVWEHPTHELEV